MTANYHLRHPITDTSGIINITLRWDIKNIIDVQDVVEITDINHHRYQE